ncbi:MAG: translesion DNA synthesis-associated protein ImuA [Limnobacter sp.]|nr:translesion DNA synthesis-associated protein ImuA [Limnobacter sp.]
MELDQPEPCSEPVKDLVQIHPSLWRAHQLGSVSDSNSTRVPSGFDELNQQLPGGGWPAGHLIELLLKHYGIGELRFLIPALRALVLDRKQLVFMNPPFLPLPNVLEQFGIPAEYVVLIKTAKPENRLWAIEKLIQSDSCGALLIWLPTEGLLQAHQLRRLQYQANKSRGLSFIFRPIEAQQQPSPATLRLTLTAHSPDALKVRLIKRRGPVMDSALLLILPIHELNQPSQELENAMDFSDLFCEPSPSGSHSKNLSAVYTQGLHPS